MSYVIQLKNPEELRKHLLTSAKASVTALKGKHRLRELRADKAEKLAELVGLVDELEKGLESLQKALPSHTLEDMPETAKRVHTAAQKASEEEKKKKAAAAKKSAKKKAKKSSKTTKKKPVKKASRKDVISDLESKLDLIESKLNKL